MRNIVEILLIFVVSYLLIKYLIFPESFFVFHYFDIYITIFPLIAYSIMYLYNEYEKPQELYYVNLGLLIYLLITFFCCLTWPLHSISIEEDYMKQFNFFMDIITEIFENIISIMFLFIILYQLKKINPK